MSARRVDAFFYGLFMDIELLRESGVLPANPRRARAVGSSNSGGRPRPVRQPCTAAVTASATGAGGMPMLAVLR